MFPKDHEPAHVHVFGGGKVGMTPFIHRTRNKPVAVRFTDEHVLIDMADGRAISMPLYFFPSLLTASDSQRQNYQLHHVSVRWEELDEGIDLIAMLTGLYIGDIARPETAPEQLDAAIT